MTFKMHQFIECMGLMGSCEGPVVIYAADLPGTKLLVV